MLERISFVLDEAVWKKKIAKISESCRLRNHTILGEAANPKNFNALARIAKQDQTVLDDMERDFRASACANALSDDPDPFDKKKKKEKRA